MKIGRFLLGIFFLMGPNISILDIFPDLIGYLLIISSVKKMALISVGVDEAKDALKKMCTVSACKILSFFLLFYLSSSSTGAFDRGWHLTFSFAFGIIELIYCLPAFNLLLDGLDSAWTRLGSGKGEEGFRSTLSFTRFFLVAKNALCVIAELPFLMESGVADATYSAEYVAARGMRSMLNLLNVFVVLMLGIVWLFKMRNYLNRFRTATFQDNAQNEYLKIVKETPNIFIRARMKTFFSVIKAGAVFAVSFTIWNINVIPSFLLGICFFIGLKMLRATIPGSDNKVIQEVKRSSLSLTAVFTSISFIQYLLTWVFVIMYDPGDGSLSYSDIISVVIGRETVGLVLFILIVAFTVLEAGCFIAMMSRMRAEMTSLAKVYTATKYEREQTKDRNELTYNTIKEAFKHAELSAYLLALCLILRIALIFVASIMWFVCMLASVLFLVLFLRATDMLSNETEIRFLYE